MKEVLARKTQPPATTHLAEIVGDLARAATPEARARLAEIDLRGAQLVEADLAGLDLSRLDLSGADLSDARLAGARLCATKLAGAVLFGADLSDAELVGADLHAANLGRCRASRAGFGGADLREARLFEAKLDHATLSQAQLGEADLRCADLSAARLHAADLRGVDLSRADLRKAELDESRVSGASFDACDLRGTRLASLDGFEQASWIGVDIRDADFRGAYQLRRFIVDENYLHEFRTQSRACARIYWLWWLTSDCGRSFSRWAAWTALVTVLFAALYELVALDPGRYPTFLSSVYYSVVTITTLGYGDVVPASVPAQIVAMLEVIVGYVALGGLISILANKMARRAE